MELLAHVVPEIYLLKLVTELLPHPVLDATTSVPAFRTPVITGMREALSHMAVYKVMESNAGMKKIRATTGYINMSCMKKYSPTMPPVRLKS